MVKEIEKAGIPTVLITNMVAVAKNIGVNRIVPGYAIPHPMSQINIPVKRQLKQRYDLLNKALKALEKNIKEPTVF